MQFRSSMLPTESELSIQKAMIDLSENLSISDMVDLHDSIDFTEYVTDKLALANTFNSDPNLMQRSDKDFNELFIDEIKGTCDLLKPHILEAFSRIFIMTNGKPPEGSVSEETLQHSINLIINTFILKKNADFFPEITITAGINAAIRNQRTRKFDKNDFDDIRHAAISLPFCDYLFTENSLHHLLITKPLKYDARYSTIIASKPEDVLAILRRDL